MWRPAFSQQPAMKRMPMTVPINRMCKLVKTPTFYMLKITNRVSLRYLGVISAKFNLVWIYCNGNYAQHRISKLHNYEAIVPTCLMLHVWMEGF
jgi:hypothetical protein